SCKIDSKGRILLPSILKRQMPAASCEKFICKKDLFENCLVLYPLDEWERQNSIIRSKLSPYNKEHSRVLRGFYRGTAEIVLDGNGRMLLPKRLLAKVGIEREAILGGQNGKIEIWAPDRWDNIGENEEEFAALAEKVLGDSKENPFDKNE
ncbi:division/cell wall cluster transcriptional repressor MraZ, partial [Bacteroidota bacterium]